jgi:hypothetical protein
MRPDLEASLKQPKPRNAKATNGVAKADILAALNAWPKGPATGFEKIEIIARRILRCVRTGKESGP